jgi:signal peptidase I
MGSSGPGQSGRSSWFSRRRPVGDGNPKKGSLLRELPVLLLIAFVLALVVKTFFVQAFFIPSGSMEQTLHGCTGCTGDRVLVNKVVYKFRDIHRGEIVVFNGKNTDFPSEGDFAEPTNAVQRVLRGVQSLIGFGAPGDGRITVNGQPIEESYVHLSVPEPGQAEFEPVTVAKDHLFVMGDHRDQSSDSRINGAIPESAVVGRAFAVFYPIGRQKALRVPDVWDPTKNGTRSGALPAADPASVTEDALSPPVLGIVLVLPLALARKRRRRTTD